MRATMIILDFIFRIAALLFLVRFLLQASGADFYNPISQAIVKATEPVAKPVRMLIKTYRSFDFASVFIAWLICVLFFVVAYFAIYSQPIGVGTLLLSGFIRMLHVLVGFYWWTILIVVIASFVAQGTNHPALALLNQLVDPLIAPVRRILPTLGPLDFSPLVVLLALTLIQDALAGQF